MAACGLLTLLLAACGGGGGDPTDAAVGGSTGATGTTGASGSTGAVSTTGNTTTANTTTGSGTGSTVTAADAPPADVAGEVGATSGTTSGTTAGASGDTSGGTGSSAGGETAAGTGAEPVTSPGVSVDPGYITSFSAGEAVQSGTNSQTDQLAGVASAGARSDPVLAGTYAIDPGALTLHYQGGDLSERSAAIVPDPANPSNLALQFLLMAANVRDDTGTPVKGRVQLNAYDTERVRSREVRFTTRMKLSADVDLLRSLGQTFDWLTISEWWNNGGWTGQAYPFRVSVNVTKPSAATGSALRFAAHAQVLDTATNKWNTTLWTVTNTSVAVPAGQWVTLEYHYRQGDAAEGRFYLALVPDGGARQVVFDVQGWTQHPDDPAPDGLTHVNPLKLYTSRLVIDHVRSAGGTLGVLWDDLGFRLCAERYPLGASPCGPESFR